jgi:cytoskeletal protein RodZ
MFWYANHARVEKSWVVLVVLLGTLIFLNVVPWTKWMGPPPSVQNYNPEDKNEQSLERYQDQHFNPLADRR